MRTLRPSTLDNLAKETQRVKAESEHAALAFVLHTGTYCLCRNHTSQMLGGKANINWENSKCLHLQMPYAANEVSAPHMVYLDASFTAVFPVCPLSWWSGKRVSFADRHLDLSSNSANLLATWLLWGHPCETRSMNSSPQAVMGNIHLCSAWLRADLHFW